MCIGVRRLVIINFSRFWRDRQGGVRVGVICICMVIVSFLAFILTWRVTDSIIGVISGMTNDIRVYRVFKLINISAGCVLVGTILLYVVWWVASSFKREDQTYFGGSSWE